MKDNSFTSKTCNSLAEFAKNALGSKFENLQAKFENAERIGDVEYEAPRMVYLYNRVLESATTLLEDPATADIVSIVELSLFRHLAEETCINNEWATLVAELGDKDSYVHTLILLSYLHDQRSLGTEIEIVGSSSTSSMSADARIRTPVQEVIDVEIKARKALWAPSEKLTEDQAYKEVETAWRKARKGRGQLGRNSSILVIGGTYIDKANLGLMNRAASRFLAERKNKDTLFIEIRSISMLLNNAVVEEDNFKIVENTTVTPQLTVQRARNSYYSGPVEVIESDKASAGRSLSKGSSEFRVEGDDKVGAWNKKKYN